MADVKLSARAKRIVEAGKTLAGPRWQSALSRATGDAVSQSLLAMIASGERQVTDEVDSKVAYALANEAERLRDVAMKLDKLAVRILRSMEGKSS
jgi:hypothetical protein